MKIRILRSNPFASDSKAARVHLLNHSGGLRNREWRSLCQEPWLLPLEPVHTSQESVWSRANRESLASITVEVCFKIFVLSANLAVEGQL